MSQISNPQRSTPRLLPASLLLMIINQPEARLLVMLIASIPSLTPVFVSFCPGAVQSSLPWSLSPLRPALWVTT